MLPGLTPPIPWGLLAGAVIAVCVVGSGAYLVHLKGAAAAVEVEALARVAETNRQALASQRALAARRDERSRKAIQEQTDAKNAAEDAQRALRAMWEARPADDPCSLCAADWPAGGVQLPGNDG